RSATKNQKRLASLAAFLMEYRRVARLEQRTLLAHRPSLVLRLVGGKTTGPCGCLSGSDFKREHFDIRHSQVLENAPVRGSHALVEDHGVAVAALGRRHAIETCEIREVDKDDALVFGIRRPGKDPLVGQRDPRFSLQT